MAIITDAAMEEMKQRLIGKPITLDGEVVAHVSGVTVSKTDNGMFHISIQANNPEEQEYIEQLMANRKAFVDIEPSSDP